MSQLRQAGAVQMRLLCLLAAPECSAVVQARHPDVPVYTAAVDRELDEHGYVRPGFGDAGDSLWHEVMGETTKCAAMVNQQLTRFRRLRY